MDYSKLPLVGIGKSTIVRRYGADVIMMPLSKLPDAQAKWLQGQKDAAKITDVLRKKNSKSYILAEIVKINEAAPIFVQAEFLEDTDKRVTNEFYNTLSEDDRRIISSGIANLINDMNQMKPVKNMEMKVKLPPNISKSKIDKINEILKWLKSHSKYEDSFVFSHTDLNSDNILYNPKTKQLSVLDFTDAEYMPVSQIFRMLEYTMPFVSDKVFDIYKSLSRVQPIQFSGRTTYYKIFNKLQNIKTIDDINAVIKEYEFLRGAKILHGIPAPNVADIKNIHNL